jgi:hypothetical protein
MRSSGKTKLVTQERDVRVAPGIKHSGEIQRVVNKEKR